MLTPKDEQELSEAVLGASDPLRIIGGGTRGVGPGAPNLSTRELTGVTLYEPGALTLVAKSGTPLAEINEHLASEGQMLAFEPSDFRPLLRTEGEPTIGGIVAANESGPRRLAVGACRDFLLGVRFVDGSGNVVKNGGRVMKNVTGYDLVKLLCGSHGTLGILSEVSLKVLPRPETSASLMIYGPTVDEAVGLMARAMGSPYEVTGAAYSSQDMAGHPVVFLRLEGSETQVTGRLSKLRNLLEPFVPTGENYAISELTDVDAVQQQWVSLRDLDEEAGTYRDVWRLSVKPSDAPSICAALPEPNYQLDWAGGRIWAFTEPGTDLRNIIGQFDGHATLIKSASNLPRFHPEPAPLANLSAGLRNQFDPRGILNSGLMG